MTDRRELILAQLLTIAQGVASITTVARNKPNIPETSLPAIVIYDGDEAGIEQDPDMGRAPASAPRRIKMTPAIEIVLGDSAADVGTSVNTIRAALIKGITLDTTLQSYVLDQRGIRYMGCVAGVALGRSMMGNMSLHFEFTYALRPEEL